ncbi:MAG: hypothetical protein WCP55_18025, partial [Lentisphaerota bacterium]
MPKTYDMEKGNGYVKWTSLVTVAVSLLGIFTTVSIFAFAQGISIDSRAREGIERIDGRSSERFSENRKTIAELMRSNLEQHTMIIGDLREIKAKMGISK